ncbi:hypothetical protein HXX76_010372 [Chlamydomonas incerta]|uniref:Uncharacterized protein n=1 Tax=Chlamydomonas incerta TaxID=51695 RepID=A0A835SRX7_CHLIN|nr:hypothetical protein HXX76_010372 [Chlamydomonas incerta]|eukprot:KAG2430277.1 hypothetical protein HXX76_010372 [Chlamydomonas incerta]
MPASGVEVGQHQNELSSESSSSYFVGADFKSQVAAGQLLFGRLSRAQGGHFSVSGGGAPEDEDAGEQRRRVLLQTMAGTPAALELCAAAAVADTFPGLLLADNGSLDELTLWLQCGGQADTAGFVTPEAEPWHAECGAPAALLAEALMRHPSEVVSAVPAPLMAIAAAGARQVCQALLHAVASLLRQQQPAAPAVHDGWDTDDVEEGDADGWGAVSGAAAGWALEPKGAQLRGQLKQLHLALQSLGLDLGLLLQQHNT